MKSSNINWGTYYGDCYGIDIGSCDSGFRTTTTNVISVTNGVATIKALTVEPTINKKKLLI